MSNETAFRAIIICGKPGVGKSTYGKVVAAERGATLLDLDTVSEKLVQVGLGLAGHDINDRDGPFYKNTFRHVVYDSLFGIARENLPHTDVVIVGPFTTEIRDSSWPERISALLGASIEVHYLTCSEKLRRLRLKERGDLRDRSKLENWEQYLRASGPDERPSFDHILISTDTPPDTCGKNSQ